MPQLLRVSINVEIQLAQNRKPDILRTDNQMMVMIVRQDNRINEAVASSQRWRFWTDTVLERTLYDIAILVVLELFVACSFDEAFDFGEGAATLINTDGICVVWCWLNVDTIFRLNSLWSGRRRTFRVGFLLLLLLLDGWCCGVRGGVRFLRFSMPASRKKTTKSSDHG